MTSLDLFLPFVLPQVPGCTDPLAYDAIRLSCIDFCRRTDIVQRVQAAVNVVAGTQDYAITPPASMAVARILAASWQGVWLTNAPPDDVQSDVALRGADIGAAKVRTGSPECWFQKTPDVATVSLYPIPDTSLTGGLLIKASFSPTLSATTVDDTLYNDWLQEIAAGAIAYLQSMPAQPFTADPRAAKIRFELGVGNAKRQKMFGRSTSASRVQPRLFA